MTTLIIPGLGGSGQDHWQTLWEKANPSFTRVEQADWDRPACDEWVNNLEEAVSRADQHTVLVAHSLGCLTVAIWAMKTSLKIRGAFLVAPPDTGSPDCPEIGAGFTPVPHKSLPFESVLVASTDDPFASIDFATDCAQAWGSHFVEVGDLGHINAASGIGAWPDGYALFKRYFR